MENKNFMVSKEIEDQVDTSQFGTDELGESNDDASSDDHVDLVDGIIVHFVSKGVLVGGIIKKYDYKIDPVSHKEEISFKFLTNEENLITFQKNMNFFKKADLIFKEKNIGNYSLEQMEVRRLTVEESPEKIGWIITIVYTSCL